MAPLARNKFGVPMLHPEVFRKQMCCWKVLVILLCLFAVPILIRRTGNCSPLSPLITPMTARTVKDLIERLPPTKAKSNSVVHCTNMVSHEKWTNRISTVWLNLQKYLKHVRKICMLWSQFILSTFREFKWSRVSWWTRTARLLHEYQRA